MPSCVVVIPIYRSLNIYEKASLKSCCNLLKNYDICFVTNKNVDLSLHLSIAKEIGVKNIFIEFFNKSYFKNIHGYNILMLSKEFYSRFCKYDYMLIFQLDAYIFKDNLEYWCNLGFDYIGAPLFPPSNGEIKIDKCFVGNGGLSLRKIDKFMEILNYKFSLKELLSIKRIESSYFIWRKKLVYFLMLFCLGRINSLFFYFSNYVFEDRFYSCSLLSTKIELKVPNPVIAAQFAYDMNPNYLYELMGQQFPFGVHGWDIRYDSFYNKFIKLS